MANQERIDPALYSAAGYCKKIGFRSMIQCATVLDMPVSTLHLWHKTKIRLFEGAVIGAKSVLDARKATIASEKN